MLYTEENKSLISIVENIVNEDRGEISNRNLRKIYANQAEPTTRSRNEDSSALAAEARQSMKIIDGDNKLKWDTVRQALQGQPKLLFKFDTGRDAISGITDQFIFTKSDTLDIFYELEHSHKQTTGHWSAGARASKGLKKPNKYIIGKANIATCIQLPAFSAKAFAIALNHHELFKFVLLMNGDDKTLANKNVYFNAFDKLVLGT